MMRKVMRQASRCMMNDDMSLSWLIGIGKPGMPLPCTDAKYCDA